jgi:hypothetical protein
MDFTVTPDKPLTQGAMSLPIPITMLKKEALRNFNICDESGAALPVMTAVQNAEMSTRILLVLGATAGGKTIDQRAARRLVTRIRFKGTIDDAVQAVIDTAKGQIVLEPTFRAVAAEMAQSFLLVAWIKVEPGERRIVKYEYEGPLVEQIKADESPRPQLIPQPAGPQGIAGLGAALNAAFQQFRVPFERRQGLLPFGVTMPAEGIGRTRSYHMEVAAPEGLAISSAILEVRDAAGRLVGGSEDHVGVDRVHLHLAEASPSKRFKSRRGQVGATSIRFRPRSDDVLRQAYIVSTLTSCVLLAGLLGHFIFHTSPRLDSVAAVVIAIPAVYAVYLAAPGEHRLVQQIVTGIRDRIWASAAFAFIAGAILTLDGLPSGVRPGVWELLALFSVLNQFIYSVGLTRSRADTNTRLGVR